MRTCNQTRVWTAPWTARGRYNLPRENLGSATLLKQNSVGQPNCRCLFHLSRIISPILSRKPCVWFICQNSVFSLTFMCNCRQYPGDGISRRSQNKRHCKLMNLWGGALKLLRWMRTDSRTPRCLDLVTEHLGKRFTLSIFDLVFFFKKMCVCLMILRIWQHCLALRPPSHARLMW